MQALCIQTLTRSFNLVSIDPIYSDLFDFLHVFILTPPTSFRWKKLEKDLQSGVLAVYWHNALCDKGDSSTRNSGWLRTIFYPLCGISFRLLILIILLLITRKYVCFKVGFASFFTSFVTRTVE